MATFLSQREPEADAQRSSWYHRKVAEHYQLDIRPYQNVDSITGSDGEFRVHVTDRFGRKFAHHARKLVGDGLL